MYALFDSPLNWVRINYRCIRKMDNQVLCLNPHEVGVLARIASSNPNGFHEMAHTSQGRVG